MNRLEEKLNKLKENNEKAFITYMTGGLPTPQKCVEIIKVQEKSGTDIIELGVPFSDPVADGPVIQAASQKAIEQGINLIKVLDIVKDARTQAVKLPIVLMLYYNTVLYLGVKEFVEKCIESGVDAVIIPDLPFEEQLEINKYLQEQKALILIQLVSPVSKNRIPMLLENARGFVYCVSSMGVTGASGAFHKDIEQYLKLVKETSKIPVMMGFGIREAKDVLPYKKFIDGAIVGSNFINIMENSNYNLQVIENYCKTFKENLK